MSTKYFLGVDEAGYGPNLGPLVVAASLWKAPLDFSEQQFLEAIKPVFSVRPWSPACSHVPLGDSKQLYKTSHGLATLEAGLLAMLGLLGEPPQPFGDLLRPLVCPRSLDRLHDTPWYAGFENLPVPSALPCMGEAMRLTSLAGQVLDSHHLQLVSLRAAIICEPQFNTEINKFGSKGSLLSHTSLELVATLTEQLTAPVEVFCDRQGGRKNYLPNLMEAFPDDWFHVIAVSPARSSYRNQDAQRSLNIHFSVGGDSFPPTALASMLAKYLRERLMQPLNAFWQQTVHDLEPTAGYPLDAKRFRAKIETTAVKMGLAASLWWRCK